MKDKIMNAMQRFSKAMFIPVLILPIVGILIAFGNILTNTKLAEYAPFLKNSVIFGFGKILSGSLVPILSKPWNNILCWFSCRTCEREKSRIRFHISISIFNI